MKSTSKSRSPGGRSSSKPRGRTGLALEVLLPEFAVCKMASDARVPDWAFEGVFTSITRSSEELSVVCDERLVPDSLDCERGWRAIKVLGPLGFSLVGVLATLAVPLARAKVAILTISTYDTDYVLVRSKSLTKALKALRDAGHRFERSDTRKDEEPPERKPAERPPPRAEEKKPVPEPPRKRYGPLAGAPPPKDERQPAKPPEPRPEPVEPRWARPVLPKAAPEPRPEPVEPRWARPAPEPRAAPPKAAPKPPAPAEEETRTFRGRPPQTEEVDSEGLFTGAIPQHPVETTDRLFTELGLSGPILETVASLGFEHPTPVQAEVIPLAMAGRDVVGLAETGSGKTAAFALPLAEKLTHGRGIRGLILCPTREIALQTQAFLKIFGRDHELDTVAVIGGVRMGPQIDGLRRKPDILVATPGRLADHLRRGNVTLEYIEQLVLDEADHMLDLGFLPQIKEILEQIPVRRQTMMFSATMPAPIESLTKVFMKDPVRVDIRPDGQAAAGIEHRLYLVQEEEDKKACLFALLEEVPGSTLVFVRRKLHTEWLARQIEIQGFPVARIHSDRSQGQRVDALRGFREGTHRILVATDVAARGLDIPGISHVVNFGPPDTVEDYVHRAGRTARGAALGIVSTIGSWMDKETVRQIEVALGIKIPRCEVGAVEAYVERKAPKQVRRRRLL